MAFSSLTGGQTAAPDAGGVVVEEHEQGEREHEVDVGGGRPEFSSWVLPSAVPYCTGSTEIQFATRMNDRATARAA